MATHDAPCPYCGCLLWFEPIAEHSSTVEETRQAIRRRFQHLSELSQRPMEPQDYYPELIQSLVSMLAARGGVVWTRARDSLRLQCAVGVEPFSRYIEDDAHKQLVARVMETREPTILHPHSPTARPVASANPTDALLMLVPIVHDTSTIAVAEIFQRGDTTALAQRGYLRFIRQICEIAANSVALRMSA